ncbi:MAG TPA: UDP-N-acetylmuramoyl-L-alanyl-D-glutamate--2,6-diaminopimelate ligase [bacterium]|nr:UDP-N-acetylmuramoyl-L-alanyl-D-glutamate--2,6-diaminopimelate ligase [bacterium]HPN44285.1 UDP-N-acetylmuramoyl-L-alanyl-D-glutamate--2,6-diaminopimelate ligase [bacterium]
MLTLKSILRGLNYQCVQGNTNVPVRAVSYHSDQVSSGDVYIAVKGYTVDGHDFIGKALSKGAGSIILQDSTFIINNDPRPFILVNDSRAALAIIAANYFDNPVNKLQLTGITGTNGKTTTACLIKAVLENNGIKTGLIGTIAYLIGNEQAGSGLSTPDALTLHSLFSAMVAQNVSACVMEVTSHALKQKRVEGLCFREAVYTNISYEHMDYHQTLTDYVAAKVRLFTGLGHDSMAILNRDDEHYKEFRAASTAGITLDYSLHDPRADIFATGIHIEHGLTRLVIDSPNGRLELQTVLPGLYNCANILAAVSTAIAKNIPIACIISGIESVKNVKGRFERIDYGQSYGIIIDYAHTPDALDKVITTILSHLQGKMITVFGSDGERDKVKRIMMGEVASRLSDITVLTTDNPRHENPEAIITDIAMGLLPGSDWARFPDRKQAIHFALSQAGPGDVVLIAGKGHENFQQVKDNRNYYDDRDSIREYFKKESI